MDLKAVTYTYTSIMRISSLILMHELLFAYTEIVFASVILELKEKIIYFCNFLMMEWLEK